MFLNPGFLVFAAAATVPLILHLMQRSRTVRFPFSTIRFLKLAQKRSSRRIRMENLLLWALRTLLILLLVFAFAMPVLRTRAFGNLLSRSRRDVAIVLDTSYSMGYSTGNETVWMKALDTAQAIVEGLEKGDRVCLFAARDVPQPVVQELTEDRAFVVSQLRSIEEGTSRSSLAPTLASALAALQARAQQPERELHIITDGQNLPWEGLRPQGQTTGNRETAPGNGEPEAGTAEREPQADWDASRIDRRTAVFVTLLGAPNPENAAPLDVQVDPGLVMAGSAARVKVTLGQTGPAQQTTVSLTIDDERMAERGTLLEGSGANVVLTVPPLTEGIHAARIDLPPDNLIADNTFHFLLRVRARLPALCVGSEADCFYLRKAIEAGARDQSALEVITVPPDKLAETALEEYVTVFLCNALPLPGQTLLSLEQYVRGGGLLAIFPGDRAAISDYSTWESLPAAPTRIDDVPERLRKRTLFWDPRTHSMLGDLVLAPGTAPLVTIRRELTWDPLPPNAQVLIRSAAERPFLLAGRYGDGQVLLFAVAADRTWSSLPLSPFFLPIAHQVIRSGAGATREQPYFWTTTMLSLSDLVPEFGRDSTLHDLDGAEVPVRGTLVDNRMRFVAENLTRPGVFTVTPHAGADPIPGFALNMDRAESDLSPVDRSEIPDLIGARTVVLADGRDDLLRLLRDYRVGRTLGEIILWLALVMAILEAVYANRSAKQPPSLSNRLGIAESGRVSG